MISANLSDTRNEKLVIFLHNSTTSLDLSTHTSLNLQRARVGVLLLVQMHVPCHSFPRTPMKECAMWHTGLKHGD